MTVRSLLSHGARIVLFGAMATCVDDRNTTAPTRPQPITAQVVSAITQTLLTTGTNPANQKVYATAAIAPAANALVTVAVLEHSSLGTPPQPTLSGGGMAAWDVVATVTFDTIGKPARRLTIFRALSAAPGSGPITITSAMTLSHCQWTVSQWTGVETSGGNGAGAVRQTGAARGDNVSGLTVSLALAANPDNAVYGVFGVRSQVAAVTPGAGFSEISEQLSGESTPGDLETEWGTNATITATWARLNGGALGIEINTSNTAPAPVADVAVDPATASVGVGATLQLTATTRDANGNVLTGRDVTWVSSDAGVATVTAAGVVTGVSQGSVTITATSEQHSGTAAVTVGAPVAAVSVTPGSASEPIGATLQLTATPEDSNGGSLTGRAVTWASSDAAVATVSGSGVVTAVAGGGATITATSEGRSGSSTVTVTGVSVASVDVSPAATQVAVGSFVQLTATPRDAAGNPLTGRSIAWASSDASIATVSGSGLVKAVSLGSATITATSEGRVGTATVTVSDAVPAVLVGAGDIAVCGVPDDEATAALLDNIQGSVFVAGDNAYDNGTADVYANCYGPTWGRHKARTRPVAGNHDYNTPGATGYYGYFGAAAGDPTKGYYSYDLGAWHVVVLNSNIARNAGSAQDLWLRADLAASPKQCQLAIWHHPLYTTSSGRVTNTSIKPFWDALYTAGVELVVNGHDHSYQRFSPQTPKGVPDPTGIRQITVGTGGADLYTFGPATSNLEVRNGIAHGVLQLTLRSDGYDWRFVPIAGQTFTDGGSGACVGQRPPPPNQSPTARPGGPYRSEAAVAFDGSASSDPDGDTPLTYAWNFGDATNGSGATPTHSYTADGVYNATLVVTDALGAHSAPVATTVTIGNIAPTVNAGPDVALGVGQSFNLRAGISDPGLNDGPWTYSIDWGDGATEGGSTTTQGGAAIAATHAYAAVGQYVVTVTVTDKDGGTGSDALSAVVNSQAPAAITHTLLAAGANPANQKIYSTAIAPAANALVTVAVLEQSSLGTPPIPTLSGGGLSTWDVVTTVTFDGATPLRRLTIFRALQAAPGSGPLTITSTMTLSNAQWIVSQWDGVDQSGVNGAGAIAQTGSASGTAVNGLTVALASFANPNDVAYGAFGVVKNAVAVTPGTGFTEISEQPSGESTPGDLEAEWALNLPGIAASWASLNGAGLGIEIKAGVH